ncbi:hypothetical protein GCM10010485_15530 [Streptosporangium carneum]
MKELWSASHRIIHGAKRPTLSCPKRLKAHLSAQVVSFAFQQLSSLLNEPNDSWLVPLPGAMSRHTESGPQSQIA